MRRVLASFTLVAMLLSTSSGCGTVANLKGEEPWLLGPAPQRQMTPFGGVDNDLRWMARGIEPDVIEPGPIVAGAIDLPLSLAGDLLTLPWTTYHWLNSDPPLKK